MIETANMSIDEMLLELNKEVIRECLDKARSGDLDKGDLASMITLLKNNKIIQEKKIHSESDLIDDLIDNSES